MGGSVLVCRVFAVFRRSVPTAGKFWLIAAGLSSCESEYPLEPTFCDDWCRATLRAGCDEEPENCVRACEQTKASEPCFDLQRELLQCYEDASDDAFLCVDGFGGDTRVRPETCQGQRDRLFECEAPGIGLCLDACRAIQGQQLSAGVDETNPEPASDDIVCPTLNVPCESVCFNFITAGVLDDLDLAGFVAPNPNNDDAGSPSPSMDDMNSDAVNESDAAQCIFEAVAACFDSTAPIAISGAPDIDELIDRCTQTD